MFGLLLQTRRARARLLSQLQDDGGDGGGDEGTVAPTLDEQLQAACVPRARARRSPARLPRLPHLPRLPRLPRLPLLSRLPRLSHLPRLPRLSRLPRLPRLLPCTAT